MSRLLDALVVHQCEIAPQHRELVLAAPDLAAARPGQFVHVLCGEPPAGDGINRYLRRPLSLFRLDRERGRVAVLYRLVGDGTRWLAARRPGDAVSVLGPLGNGFPLPDAAAPAGPDRALLVGGGVGIPPLLPVAERLLERGLTVEVFLGARTAAGILAEEDFRGLGLAVRVATDDGSRGEQGTVIGPLAAALASGGLPAVYACGPAPMLRAVQSLAARLAVPAYLSVEERMACGVGACLGCPVAVPAGSAGSAPAGFAAWPSPAELAGLYRAVAPGAPAAPYYKRACVDGPVFPAWGVLFPPASPAPGPMAGAAPASAAGAPGAAAGPASTAPGAAGGGA